MTRKELNLESFKKAFEDTELGTEFIDLVMRERELEIELQKVRRKLRNINNVS